MTPLLHNPPTAIRLLASCAECFGHTTVDLHSLVEFPAICTGRRIGSLPGWRYRAGISALRIVPIDGLTDWRGSRLLGSPICRQLVCPIQRCTNFIACIATQQRADRDSRKFSRAAANLGTS